MLNQNSNVIIHLAQPAFMVGQTIKGSVLIDMGLGHESTVQKLMLYFRGYDEVVQWDRVVKKKHRFMQRKVTTNKIVSIDLQLADWDKFEQPQGKTAYKFSIKLAETIPPSCY
jgi:hypothetical protein